MENVCCLAVVTGTCLSNRCLSMDFRACSLLRDQGEPLAINGLPIWLHYSGFQASCHNTLSKRCWSWGPFSGPIVSRGVRIVMFYRNDETSWRSDPPSNGPYRLLRIIRKTSTRLELACRAKKKRNKAKKNTVLQGRFLQNYKSGIRRHTKLSVVVIISLLTRSRLINYSWELGDTISKSQQTTQSPDKNTAFQELLSTYQLLSLDKLTLWLIKTHRNDIIN
jgi:hypothetical protein